MDWQEEYRRKLVSAEEAVKTVKSGDVIDLRPSWDGELVIEALFARRNELQNVMVFHGYTNLNPGWWNPGSEDSFIMVPGGFQTKTQRNLLDIRRCDYFPHGYSNYFKADERPGEGRQVDVAVSVVSPPDKHGYCSFGQSPWYTKTVCKKAKKVIAEVNNNYIRTYGDNSVHVSEIDYFVEYTPKRWTPAEIEEYLATLEDKARQRKLRQLIEKVQPKWRSYLFRQLLPMKTENLTEDILRPLYTGAPPTEEERRTLEFVASLIRDGDTYEIGGGGSIIQLYIDDFLENKHDLGIHTEHNGTGLVKLMKGGVITGKYKTINCGKVVQTCITGLPPEDVEYLDMNPMIELYPVSYVINVRTIAAHDNMVSVNQILSIDLTGQITAESGGGPRQIGGPGGQPAFHIGAVLSKGGRAISVIESTHFNGAVSSIVPFLPEGTTVTITRDYADYVVSEWGIARLMGKTIRERAEELIRIAHPDFRSELRKAAQKLRYP